MTLASSSAAAAAVAPPEESSWSYPKKSTIDASMEKSPAEETLLQMMSSFAVVDAPTGGPHA